jgi:pilus assembly protein CpaF
MGLQERLGLNGAMDQSASATMPISSLPLSSPTSSLPFSGAPGMSRRNARRAYDPLAGVRKRAHAALLEQLGPQLYETVSDDAELERRVRELLPSILNREEQMLTPADRTLVYRQVLDEILGHGPIEPLLRDPDITEIMVNSWDRIYVERFGHIHTVDAAFMDEAHLRRVIDKIVSRVGRRVDEASPMVDARLPDGSRVNAVVPPIALDGAALTSASGP